MARIIIPLEVDEDGYPPFASERIWASETADGLYSVDNIPFYARRIALGDLVAVERVDDAIYFRNVVQPSENSTVRVVFLDKGQKCSFENGLRAIDCDWEGDQDRGLLAINVPSAAHHRALMGLIERCGGEESVDYEESALRFLETDQT